MNINEGITTLLLAVPPVLPYNTVNEVAQLFLSAANKRLLCLPIVNNDGQLMGTISRQRMQSIFMTRFGRELFGRNKITGVMNSNPLVVDKSLSLASAAEHVSAKIDVPITEDFIITEGDKYLGMGSVLDLLRAMELQVYARNNELAEAYRSLQSSQAQLIQSEKMASLGQMVAGVAHEINTPLGYVRSNVELTQNIFMEVLRLLEAFENFFMLSSEERLDKIALEQQFANLEDIRQNFYENSPLEDLNQLFEDVLYGIGQISEMVVNLKNFSRLDQAAMANVDLNKCIDSSLVIAKNVLKHKCQIIKEFGKLPTISCSPSQINQIFLNLLTNAAQAIQHMGLVTITTWNDDNYVHARITDNGKGIEKEHLTKIFDPFFTTKPIGQGTGLGLSIVYSIIEQHKGHIKVESKPGKGSSFTVSLPRLSQNSKGTCSD